MVFLRKSSFTIGLRTGTILTATLNLLIHVVLAVGVPVVVHTVVNKVTEMIDSTGIPMMKDFLNPIVKTFVDFSYVILGACGVMAIASLILLFGAVLEMKRWLVPFLVLQPVLYLFIIFGLYKASLIGLPALPALPDVPTTPAGDAASSPVRVKRASAPGLPADSGTGGLGGAMNSVKIGSGVGGIFLGLIMGYFTLVVASYYVQLWKDERYQTRTYILKTLKNLK